jgi:hypothetical protein
VWSSQRQLPSVQSTRTSRAMLGRKSGVMRNPCLTNAFHLERRHPRSLRVVFRRESAQRLGVRAVHLATVSNAPCRLALPAAYVDERRHERDKARLGRATRRTFRLRRVAVFPAFHVEFARETATSVPPEPPRFWQLREQRFVYRRLWTPVRGIPGHFLDSFRSGDCGASVRVQSRISQRIC